MEESWQKDCYKLVAEIVTRRDWHLVTDLETFAKEICLEVEKRELTKREEWRQGIENAAIGRYSPILYEACRADGSPQQRMAFEELSRRLYSIALKKVQKDELAKELTQQAIVNIYKSLRQVDDPSLFIGWTWVILLNLIRDYFQGIKLIPEDVDDEAIEPRIEAPPDDLARFLAGLGHVAQAHPDPSFDHAMRDQFYEQLKATIKACVNHELQQAVLIKSLVEREEYQEIAQDLHLQVNYVHQLRFQGLKTLHACEAYIQFVEDWKS